MKTAALVLAGISVPDSLIALTGFEAKSTPFWEGVATGTLMYSDKEIESLRANIEKKYNISIYQPTLPLLADGMYYEWQEYGDWAYDIVRFSPPNLVSLSNSLYRLPQHFYKPIGNTPIKLYCYESVYRLDPNIGYHRKFIGTCHCSPQFSEIYLKETNIGPLGYRQIETDNIITHELTHKIYEEFQISDNEIAGVVKEELSKIKSKLYLFLKVGLPFTSLKYGCTDWGEFLSVGAQVYTMGEDIFKSTYTGLIPNPDSWYNWMKNNIFQDYEYPR